MANRDVLAIGTSAGGVEALILLAKRFPRDFPAAVLVTIHLPSHSRLGARRSADAVRARCRRNSPATATGSEKAASISPRRTGTCCSTASV
jgi:hypothetical protein